MIFMMKLEQELEQNLYTLLLCWLLTKQAGELAPKETPSLSVPPQQDLYLDTTLELLIRIFLILLLSLT